MRTLTLASYLALALHPALAQPLCAFPDQPAPLLNSGVVRVAGPPPGSPTIPPALALPELRSVQTPSAPRPTTDDAPGNERLTAAILRRIAASGAVLTDVGIRHGMLSVLARKSDEFMLLWVVPGGAAAVAGFPMDLSAAELAFMAGNAVTFLGTHEGLEAMLVRSGAQFQVFYATPDGTRVIPGIMWDAEGRNLTRKLVASVEGSVPTVTLNLPRPISAEAAPAPAAPSQGGPSAAGMAVVERAASAITIGDAAAPHVWMLADPQCGYSLQAMQRLQPLVAGGRLRLSIVPVAVLDPRNGGRSTSSSLGMLSLPADRSIEAWGRGQLQVSPAPDAPRQLEANMALVGAVELRGTPTFFWRKADGSEGRLDGLASDLEARLASARGD